MLDNGKRLAGRYEIVQPLGGGGMAMVYQAQDRVLDRWVAIKVMNESLIDQSEFIQRFIREAKAAGSMSHSNIVNVYDIGRENSTYFMVMEYIEGTTLADYLQQKSNVTINEALEIVNQICDGLAHAHHKGIIHRDIKMQNIMRTIDGRYKVTDFGISYFSHMNTSLTQTGTVMGSAHYFSPEQASGGQVDYSSDVYSLGILLYKMLTKKFPFDAENSVSIALKHMQEPVPDPRKYNPVIPEELVQVIFKALEKKQEDRFQSIDEMKQAILAIQSTNISSTVSATNDHHSYETEYTSFPPRQKVTNHKTKEKKSTKFKISMSLTVALILLLSCYLIGWKFWNNKEPISPKVQKNNKALDKSKKKVKKPNKSRIDGDHPWWKELPKPHLMENRYFRQYKVHGKNGKYEVSLKVGKMPENSFKYNIYVVDGFSSRLILNGRNVSFHPKPDASGYTSVDFQVTIPEQLLPNPGILKIEIFRMSPNGDKIDATDNMLQKWGKIPEKYQT